jgi:hypothetical protein
MVASGGEVINVNYTAIIEDDGGCDDFSATINSAVDLFGEEDLVGVLDEVSTGWTGGVSAGLSLLPAGAGCLSCSTALQTVVAPATVPQPVAKCDASVSTYLDVPEIDPRVLRGVYCVDQDTCTADVDINNGSWNPDDPSDTLTLTQSPAGPYSLDDYDWISYSVNRNPVDLTVTNSAGGVDSCSSAFVLEDCVAPEITGCPGPVTLECAGPLAELDGQPGALHDPPAVTATDQCSALDSFFTKLDFGLTPYPLGETPIEYFVVQQGEVTQSSHGLGMMYSTCAPILVEGFVDEDLANALSQGNSTVTVVDTGVPDVTGVCPADQTLECTGNSSAVGTYSLGEATDVCEGTLTPTCSSIAGVPVESGSRFGTGTTPVDCAATDSSGNSSSCRFYISVEDTQPPAISCPADQTLECTGNSSAVASYSPTATDACSNLYPITCNPVSGASFNLGTKHVSCQARDNWDNQATCELSVTVQDTTRPTLALVGNVPPIECGIESFIDLGATVSDTCDAALNGSTVSGTGSVDTTTVGSYSVSYAATDASLNAANRVTRTVSVVDTTRPTLALVGSVPPIECGIGSFTDPGATISDVCDAALNGSTVSGTGSVDTTTVGSYPVTYAATDASLNAAIGVTRAVSVVDTTPPEISCPADITVEPESPQGTRVYFAAASYSDVCDQNLPTPTCPRSGTVFDVGTETVVSCSVADATSTSALSSSCSLTVKVLSEAEVVESLEGVVADLGDGEVVNSGQARALMRHLDSLLKSIERGKTKPSCGKLSGWFLQIETWVADGHLTEGEAQPLIDSATSLWETLGCNGE